MSLDWTIDKIADYKTLCWVPAGKDADGDDVSCLNPVTNAIIWGTILTGLGSITEDNWRQFYARLHVAERLFGQMLYDGKLEAHRYITADEVRAHVGLTTNVSRETDAAFARRMTTNALRQYMPREEKEGGS